MAVPVVVRVLARAWVLAVVPEVELVLVVSLVTAPTHTHHPTPHSTALLVSAPVVVRM